MDFAIPAAQRETSTWQRTKKAVEHMGDGNANCNWCTWKVHKALERLLEEVEIWGRAKTIQTTALLRSARILRWIRETWEDLLSLRLQWKSISKRWCEKLVRNNHNNNNNQQKKENLQNCRLCCPGWPQNKIERMWKEG